MRDAGQPATTRLTSLPNLVALLRARSHETHAKFDFLCEPGWRTVEEQAADEIEHLRTEINAMHKEINGARTS
ncbi:MAG: hypothetical protein ACRYGM_07185 [Janthinobacterium lividum]